MYRDNLILIWMNLCKKVPGKKVYGKKTWKEKLWGKNPNFLKSLEKMSLEIKSCILDSWDFFSLNSMGAANKVSGNKISGKKVLKKINPRKRKT